MKLKDKLEQKKEQAKKSVKNTTSQVLPQAKALKNLMPGSFRYANRLLYYPK